ncbi:uncharacterized protein B0H18DRAFT_1118484 [Fomitopsis serialis]|uniref:uncharacterized protein n=1 Tax=Fomitopsis serialis TaxID=139415 RepID=UPI002008E238|nr:uncharacterized protein B0H18DRAFT_1118484 [Neoantrodia serialis]KAH9927703.1 hypothetical protein B0H18DRAFT_1118484 [Neoantrodia serialis]
MSEGLTTDFCSGVISIACIACLDVVAGVLTDFASVREWDNLRARPLKPKAKQRLGLLATVVTAFKFYVWCLMQWKGEVGGWWKLALGKRPPQLQHRDTNGSRARANANALGFEKDGGNGEVERRIEELAVALGIPSKDLTNVIAGAVRDHVPLASLSSIAAHETGEVVGHLVDPSGASASEAQSAPGSTASRGFWAWRVPLRLQCAWMSLRYRLRGA